jgi:hypothetical protein
MVTVPGQRAFYDLPIHSGIALEPIVFAPRLKVEEVREEWERLFFVQQPQTDC